MAICTKPLAHIASEKCSMYQSSILALFQSTVNQGLGTSHPYESLTSGLKLETIAIFSAPDFLVHKTFPKSEVAERLCR
jgi:hypothetical protein